MGENTVFSNVIGSFVFDEKGDVVDKVLSRNAEKDLAKKHNAKQPGPEELKRILKHFKNNKYFKDFHEKNLLLTKKDVRNSLQQDSLIIQTINAIDEENRITNILAKRLREWYELHNPEFSKSVQDHEKFAELILKKDRKTLLKEIGISENESMGAALKKEDLGAIKEIAEEIKNVSRLREKHTKYLERLMKECCPNLQAVADTIVGAKLIALAGSLKRLAEFPSSTIQLLGAEKALFRHMRTGSRPPKHGVILQHPLVSKAKKGERGKAARTLADKISIAVKVDKFKGEFIGQKLRKELEAKLGK